MDSNSWNLPDQAMMQNSHGNSHANAAGNREDDFHNFLSMDNLGALGDGLDFDFRGFHDMSASQLPQLPSAQHRSSLHGARNASMQMGPAMIGADGSSGGGLHMSSSALSDMASSPALMGSMPMEGLDSHFQMLKHQHSQLSSQKQPLVHMNNNRPIASMFGNMSNPSQRVPPTPQSLEITPTMDPYYAANHTPQQTYEDRYPSLQDTQELIFTPLVSPAVTPLDANFILPEHTMTSTGAFFTPLTSPALLAQNEQLLYDQPRTRSLGDLPMIDLNLDQPFSTGTIAEGPLAKTRRVNTVNAARAKPSVRNSPINKAQRKKQSSLASLPPQVIQEAMEQSTIPLVPTQAPTSNPASSSSSTHISSTDQARQYPSSAVPSPFIAATARNAPHSGSSEGTESVSPAALSEMLPPPIPTTKKPTKSPAIKAMTSSQSASGAVASVSFGKPSPATPASLMRLPASSSSATNSSGGSNAGHTLDAIDGLDDFVLPDASVIDLDKNCGETNASCSKEATPVTITRALACATKLPLPVSASPSPQLAPTSSSGTSKRTPQLAPRGGKKRTTASVISTTVQASPSLRPRISPNLMPLLPSVQGPSAEDMASRLLASKSNYQNIMEGNTVPGVSYPSELSTNLTYKRTSHKLAEQGRRNRINTALQEMAQLLPGPTTANATATAGSAVVGDGVDNEEAAIAAVPADGGDKKNGKSNGLNSNNNNNNNNNNNGQSSKAHTVERAIAYIKELQQRVEQVTREAAEARERAEKAERQLSTTMQK